MKKKLRGKQNIQRWRKESKKTCWIVKRSKSILRIVQWSKWLGISNPKHKKGKKKSWCKSKWGPSNRLRRRQWRKSSRDYSMNNWFLRWKRKKSNWLKGSKILKCFRKMLIWILRRRFKDSRLKIWVVVNHRDLVLVQVKEASSQSKAAASRRRSDSDFIALYDSARFIQKK